MERIYTGCVRGASLRMMIEPAGTLNTGSASESDRTVAEPDWI
ncbi:hypothetical protein [Salinispira pacifica]